MPLPGQHDTRPYGAPLGRCPWPVQDFRDTHPRWRRPSAPAVPPQQHGLPGPSATPAAPWAEQAPPPRTEAPPPPGRRRRGRSRGARPRGGAVGGIAADRIADGVERRPVSASLPLSGSEPAEERPAGSVAAIAATVLPSVVSLQVEGRAASRPVPAS
ncbi:hypothetical protein NKG05_23585 [Oerskovia sp. M15]